MPLIQVLEKILFSPYTDPFGAEESFTYDAAANITQRDDTLAGHSFTTTFDHTPRNQVKSVSRGGDTSAFSFDATGNLATKTYPNGVNTAYAYDADGRLTSQQALQGGQTLQSYSQTYDAAGNITQLTENGSLTTNYSYDSINRLTAENIGGYGNLAYSYDRTGNRTSLTNPITGQTTYSYNQANQLTQQVNGQDTTGFTYNSGGALTQKTSGADTTSFTYNGLDKLTEATMPATTVSYAYDALGRRTQRTEASDTTNIHFSATSDLPDYWSDAAGNITASLQRGPDGLTTFTLDPLGSPFPCYQLFSPHGDTTMITDSAGDNIAATRYDSFGNTIGGVTGLWYGYTGKYERYSDGATGAIEMGVREYDPALGRFISADPLKGTTSDPQQRNRYPYVANDPMSRYDLDGFALRDLFPWLDQSDERNSSARRDLGYFGNKIRNQIDSDFGKDLFENYWNAGGDVELSDERFNDIIRSCIMQNEMMMAGIILSNSQYGKKGGIDCGNSPDYGPAIGRGTIYIGKGGIPVGFSDTYDFDPHGGFFKSDRGWKAELKTQMVWYASPFYNTADFNIHYGITEMP